MVQKKLTLILLVIVLLTVACEQQPDLTATLEPPPTVTLVQATTLPDATEASLPATATGEIATATVAAATATMEAATPTLAATDTVEPTPESDELSIAQPGEGTSWATGTSVTISGSAPAGTDVVSVTLRAAGLVLAEAEAPPGERGDWQTTLDIPENMTGTVILRAATDGDAAVEVPVGITLPGATSAPSISLTYPDSMTTVVSNHVLFFTGTAQRPEEGMVTISLLYEDCQTAAATTSFDVGEGGQWWGYIVVPETVFGSACALAYFGDFNEAGWRGAQSPITILEQDDPQSRGLFIGNFANSELPPGEAVTVYGSAYNVPNGQVEVALQIDGAAVAQGTATADRFGYWEIELTVPTDVSATASGQFTAAVSYDGQQISESVPFEVEP